MVEVDHELATALFSKKHKDLVNAEERTHADAEQKRRKLARMEAVRQVEGAGPQLPHRVSELLMRGKAVRGWDRGRVRWLCGGKALLPFSS